MVRPLVFHTDEVMAFTTAPDVYESRMLVDPTNSGSDRVQINQYVLKPGMGGSEQGSHPELHIYFVVSGRAALTLGDPPEVHELRAGHVVIMPPDTLHGLKTIGDEDFETLTIWPGVFPKGVNELYDMRLEAWGRSFRLVREE